MYQRAYVVNPRPLLAQRFTGKRLFDTLRNIALNQEESDYAAWLLQNKAELIPIVDAELRLHYIERAQATPRTRKQRENDIAGSIESGHKQGRGDKRKVYLSSEEKALAEIRPEQTNVNASRYDGTRRYTFLSKLDDAQLETLWGYFERSIINRGKISDHNRKVQAKVKAGDVSLTEAQQILPPGPWSQQIPKNVQREVRHTLERADMLDLKAGHNRLPELWEHARIYREEWKVPWHQAFQIAVDEQDQAVLDAMAQDPDDADIVLEHDATSGTILRLNSKLDKSEYAAIVRENGFKWSRREGFAYRVRSRGRRKPTTNVLRVILDAQKNGRTIAYSPPRDLDLDRAIAAARAASEERAEVNQARAAKKAAEAREAFQGARESIQHIPPGQPILRGHHSERRHRRDLARYDARMRKGIEAQRAAAHYASREDAYSKASRRRDVTVSGQTIRIPKRLWNWTRKFWEDSASEASNALFGPGRHKAGDRGSHLVVWDDATREAVQHFYGIDGIAINPETEYGALPSKDRQALKRQALQVEEQADRLRTKNPRRRNAAPPPDKITRRDYPGVFGDVDHDALTNVDDPHPYTPGDTHPIEEVSLADEIGALIDARGDFVATKNATMADLQALGGPNAEVKGRVKSPYSMINKLRRKRLGTLTDLAGTMLVVEDYATLREAAAAIQAGQLGKVLDQDDYYARPQAGYRAMHYIVERDGVPVEIQLKTRRGAAIALAGHTSYKQGNQDAVALESISALAFEADKGDPSAAAEVDELLLQPDRLMKMLTK